jgi:heme oxygenase (biliverdin-IX-beta and delta-forming)
MPDIAVPTPPIVDFSRPPRTPLRTLLRDATAAEHARLDAKLGALDLCEAAGYRRFLEINAAALLPLEQSLLRAGVRAVLPDWDDRARSEAILRDLSQLSGAPRLLDAPVLADRSAVLGTLYVLEGSRLGAAYLLRAVRQCSDPLMSGNTAFLAHGAGRPLWPSFLSILERHADELGHDADIVAPARRAFALFEQAATLS